MCVSIKKRRQKKALCTKRIARIEKHWNRKISKSFFSCCTDNRDEEEVYAPTFPTIFLLYHLSKTFETFAIILKKLIFLVSTIRLHHLSVTIKYLELYSFSHTIIYFIFILYDYFVKDIHLLDIFSVPMEYVRHDELILTLVVLHFISLINHVFAIYIISYNTCIYWLRMFIV
jgi:hypothetical protein